MMVDSPNEPSEQDASIKWHILVAFLIFLTCFSNGLILAQRKPLWTDEIFTQVTSIDPRSYKDILFSELIGEDNLCPLFYLIQKTVSNVTGYRYPHEWDGTWSYSEPKGQVILRLSSIVFMSLSLAFLYFYFARTYSVRSGAFAVLVALSSSMVWEYWAEARPYSLWFLLTTAQILLFLNIHQKEQDSPKSWLWLVIIHLLMSLTIVFSVGQILIVSFLLLFLKRANIARFFLGAILPTILCIYFLFQSMSMDWWSSGKSAALTQNLVQLKSLTPALRHDLNQIYLCLSGEWLMIIGIYCACLCIFGVQNVFPLINFYKKDTRWEGGSLLALLVLFILFALTIVAGFHLWTTKGDGGFTVLKRYFMYLTPVAVISTALFSTHLYRIFNHNQWMKMNLIILFGGLILIRMINTYFQITILGVY